MKRFLKYLGLIVIGLVLIVIAFSDRELKLGIVNSNPLAEDVEIFLDGKHFRNIRLESSIIPNEFIETDLSMGFHTVEVVAKNCETKRSFSFLNLIGYHISLEYHQGSGEKCKSMTRTSCFGLIYQ